MTTTSQQRVNDLRAKIQQMIIDKNYQLIGDLTNVVNTKSKISYQCSPCGTEKLNVDIRSLECGNCRYCKIIKDREEEKTNPLNWWVQDKEEHTDKDKKVWKSFRTSNETFFWVREDGKTINRKGEEIKLRANGKIYIETFPYSPERLVAIAFKITNYEFLLKERYNANGDRIVAEWISEKIVQSDDLSPINLRVVSLHDNRVRINDMRKTRDILYAEVPDSHKNVPYKILPELRWWYIFNTGEVYQGKHEIGGMKWLSGEIINEKVFMRHYSLHYELAKLVLILFSPIEGKTCYNDYDDLIVIHKDKNFKNNKLENLYFVDKPKSITEQIKYNIQEQIKENQTKVIEYVNYRDGELLTDISLIVKVTDEFAFKCACGEQFIRKVKDITDITSECVVCRTVRIHNQDEDQTLNFTKDNREFARIKGGWICKEGFVLNSKKEYITPHKNTITLLGKKINLKHLLVKSFKVKGYQYLESDPENFYVIFRNQINKSFHIDNLYVVNRSETSIINGSDVSEKDIKDIPFKLLEEFKGYTFYSNGIIRLTNGKLSRGYIERPPDESDDLIRWSKSKHRKIQINHDIYSIPRLICYAFNPIKELGQTNIRLYANLEVNHLKKIDEKTIDKSCNDSRFLEWTTKQENMKHCSDNHLHPSCKTLLVYKLLNNKRGEFYKRFLSFKDVKEELNVSHNHIKNVAEGKTKPIKWWFEYEL
jgi:hypothetical protein